jgi:O-antigen/teichoic acid export membrane protein
VPVLIAVGAVSWFLFRKRIPQHEASNPSSENFPTTRQLISLSLAQYATSLIGVFSSSVVALIVIERLGAVAEAHYYLPALIYNGVAMLLWNLVTSFLVEASSEPTALRQHANVTIRAAVVVLMPAVVIGEVFAPEFLRVFGTTYAAHGTTLLRMLLLSLPCLAITSFYYSLAMLDRRVWFLAGCEFASAAVYFGVLLSLMGHFGILSIGIAALVSSGLQGLFFLPPSIRRYRAIAHTDGPEGGTATPAVPGA